MVKKANEKNKKKNTKDNSLFNLDNEIIIGIKTLPEPELPKSKKKKSKANLKKKNKKVVKKDKSIPKKEKITKNRTTSKKIGKKRENNEPEEFDFSLQIDNELKKSKNKNKINKKTKGKTPRQITKKQEIQKKKRRAILKLVKWTTLILILIGGIIYFLLSPFFNVKSIEVEGNQKLTQEELISLSEIELENNIFKIKKGETQKNIKQNAYVENVKVKRKLPNSVQIKIIERKPTYMIAFANAYVYINNQGYFLEVSKKKIDMPIITGFSTPEEEIYEGNRFCLEDLQKLDQVLQIMKIAESNELDNLISKINILDKQNYILELKKEKKTVYMGDTSNLSTKMLYIKSILEQNKNIEGEIFVNTDLNNKGAIFRKKI